MSLSILYPEFESLTKGGSFSLVITTLYYAHLLRYSTAEMLKCVAKSVKIATKKKLNYLCDMGYLVNNDGVFTSTAKTLELLVKNGYKSELLPPPAEGRGVEIYNSTALVSLILQPDFKALLYPHFGYLIPDGLVVVSRGDKYALQFVEVERKKANWVSYLEEKRKKYEQLGRDEIVFRYWQLMAPNLGLKFPRIEDFKFSVLCLASIKLEGYRGWKWITP